MPNPGIVDQDVDCIEICQNRCGGRVQRGAVGQVEGIGASLFGPGGQGLRDNTVQPRGIPAQDRQAAPLRGEFEHDMPPDSVTSAGDNRRLSLELHIFVFLRWRLCCACLA